MTTQATASVLAAALITTGTLCLALLLLIVLIKCGRALHVRRRAELLTPYRPDLLAVATGEDPDGAGYGRIARATGAAAEALADALVGLLGKVRGAPADDLIRILTTWGNVRAAAGALSGRSRGRRARAARLLGRCRESGAVPRLTGALDDGAVEVRAQAAHALGAIGDAAAAGPLLRSIGATDAGIPAGIAATALLSMGTGISDALRDGLADPHPRTRTVAAHVSGAGSYIRSRPRLRRLLAEDPDLIVRSTCAQALGVIGNADDVAALARRTHRDEPLPLRRSCATALGDLGEPAALPALTALLRDPDPRLAELAAAAMLRLSPEAIAVLADVSGRQGSDPRRGRPVESALLVARLRGTSG